LQLLDPWKVNAYREELHRQLTYHNIDEKLQSLMDSAKNNSWSPNHTLQTIQIQSVEVVRFWHLLLKRSKGLPIADSTITQARISAGLPLHNSLELADQPYIILQLRAALSYMRSQQKSHVKLHEAYLDGLAEALILQKRPWLKEKEQSQTLTLLTASTMMGPLAYSQATSDLLAGVLPSNIDYHLQETTEIVQVPACPLALSPQEILFSITPDQFVGTYKVVQEKTSSSLSGRHVGHYKAVLEDSSL
jgi:hypothetical protein